MRQIVTGDVQSDALATSMHTLFGAPTDFRFNALNALGDRTFSSFVADLSAVG